MSIYLWSSEPSKIYVWSSEVKSVYVWTTKVRPAAVVYFDFSTSDLQWYSNYVWASPWLTIDTTNQRCIPWANTTGNCGWDIYKDWTVTNSLHMRVKWKFLSLPSVAYSSNWFWCWTIWDSSKSISAQVELNWGTKVFKLVWPWNANRWSVTPNYSANVYYYIDIMYKNWTVTAKLMDTNMTVLNTLTHSVTQSNWRKWFWAYTQKNSSQNVEIKEYLEECY